MRFRDGTLPQRLLFALFVGTYVLGVILTASDAGQRVGKPDLGFIMDGFELSPSRRDAADAGLRGGARLLAVNGLDVAGRSIRYEVYPRFSKEAGATNALRVQRGVDDIADLELAVRPLEWRDWLYGHGGAVALGFLFFAVGVVTFWLRPWTPESWALLSLCTIAGGYLTTMLVGVGQAHAAYALYFRSMIGFLAAVPLHAALAFPVAHHLLRGGRRRTIMAIYSLGVVHALAQVSAWSTGFIGPFRYIGLFDTSLLLVVSLMFVGRCTYLAMRASDVLIAQRARILLGGTLFGAALPIAVRLVQAATGMHILDTRIAYWSLAILLLALVRTTLRPELLNARVAARRAVVYGAAVGALTALAVALVSVSPYLVAMLLLPLLYVWPSFEALLNDWLYPKRARMPQILREIGEDLTTAPSVDGVLDVLASAPERMIDVHGSTAFLFEDGVGREECVRGAARERLLDLRLADASLIQLMIAMKREIFREQIALEPQYENVREECYATFDRLGAAALLPILRDGRAIGALALGAQDRGDVYERLELENLKNAAQLSVQALTRIEATDRLRSRELEFTELKRFFPPAIIDQVMARGGVSELRSQRRLVTVFFADLRGFTAFAERVEPEEVMATLAEYHGVMGQRISAFAGTLERFAGDGFMVFFNDPVDQPDHVERSARMALSMQRVVAELRDGWARRGYRIDVGMGIHTGYATCGFIGYEGRRDYAVIGNVTNMAARLSDAAAGGEILISSFVREELRDAFLIEPKGELALQGFSTPQPVYRLVPEPEPGDVRVQ